MARLLSVNLGLPRDIEWKGRTVHTGIWKDPVPGRCRVGRLNLDGDGQGDLAGHGGEQRAVFVYQIECTCSPCPVDRSGPIATSPRVEGTGAYALAISRGSVTVPGVAIARRVASARYAAGSTPASFADSSSVYAQTRRLRVLPIIRACGATRSR